MRFYRKYTIKFGTCKPGWWTIYDPHPLYHRRTFREIFKLIEERTR